MGVVASFPLPFLKMASETEVLQGDSSIHLLTHLRSRATNPLSPSEWYHHTRELYTIIIPDGHYSNVKTPDGCYLRKFSPDGRHLLAFSQDQRSVELFQFKGSTRGTPDLQNDDRNVIFKTFFEHLVSVAVCHGNEVLNRECSLFLENCDYVIVVSSYPLPDDIPPHMFETFQNNESLSPNYRFILENYTIHILNLKTGWSSVSDSRSFKCDKIFLSHNQGLSLCRSKLAVLSSQHQSIHLFDIVDGLFIPLQVIGRFCYHSDSQLFTSSIHSSPSNGEWPVLSQSQEHQPFLEKWINSLKHRLLCYIKKEAERVSLITGDNTHLMQFYRRFDYYNSLRIWKMQLLDESTLLLKYSTEDVVTMRVSDPLSQPAFFVFYDIDTTQIFGVYENSSLDFLKLYENSAEHFRVSVSHPLNWNNSCVSNCYYCRQLHQKFKLTITNARHGGVLEATKRLLVQVPVCSQSFSSSPYLDFNLFRYDDKWVSALERPKPCGDTPVRYGVTNVFIIIINYY